METYGARIFVIRRIDLVHAYGKGDLTTRKWTDLPSMITAELRKKRCLRFAVIAACGLESSFPGDLVCGWGSSVLYILQYLFQLMFYKGTKEGRRNERDYRNSCRTISVNEMREITGTLAELYIIEQSSI